MSDGTPCRPLRDTPCDGDAEPAFVRLNARCSRHTVATCVRCRASYSAGELAWESFTHAPAPTPICPRCLADLTEEILRHIAACPDAASA